MSIAIICLIVISALLHSLWNVILKRLPDTSASAVAFALLACFYALAFGAFNLSSVYSWRAIVPILLSGILAGGALWAQGMAFRTGTLGLTYAVNRAGSILLLWPISAIFLGEKISTNNIIGVSMLTFAITTIMLPKKGLKIEKSLAWASLGALFIVGYSVCYKMTINAGGNPITVLGLSDIFRVLIAFLLLDGNRIQRIEKTFTENIRPIVFMSIASFGSFGIFLYALKFEGAAHLVTLRNLSILFTAVAGVKSGDHLSRSQYILILIALIGTIFIGA